MIIDPIHYLQSVRQIVTVLPGVEEYICFRTPAFRVKKKLLARLKEDEVTIAVHADDRDEWMNAGSDAFYITDHYRNSSMVLVRLDVVQQHDLENVLLQAWKQIAPKKLLDAYARSQQSNTAGA
jgi:hypothetical protein